MTNSNPKDDVIQNNNYPHPATRRVVSRRSALGLLGFGAAAAALLPTLFKTAQVQNQATSLNGKLYVFGGEQWVPEQKVFAESWVYDPKTDIWEALPPLPTPRHGLRASAVANRIFVFGGATKTGGDAATTSHEVLVLPTK